MNGKLLSGFLCVLLIATFQVENSEAFTAKILKNPLKEVREEISWIHSQIVSYQTCRHTKSCNGYFTFQSMPPSIKKDNIVESNSKTKIIFKKIEQFFKTQHFVPLLSSVYWIQAFCVNISWIYCKALFWIINKVFCCHMHKSCVYLNSSSGPPGTGCVRPLETWTVIGPSMEMRKLETTFEDLKITSIAK